MPSLAPKVDVYAIRSVVQPLSCGRQSLEGHGADPDIEVIDDPAKMVDGDDPQLDAAIVHMLEQLETNAYQAPERPAYPDRRKIGLDPKDK